MIKKTKSLGRYKDHCPHHRLGCQLELQPEDGGRWRGWGWWSEERTMAQKSLLHLQLLFLLSPSTSISSLLLLCFCSLKAIVFFFKTRKGCTDAVCVFFYFLFLKKPANRMARSGSSDFPVSDRFERFKADFLE